VDSLLVAAGPLITKLVGVVLAVLTGGGVWKLAEKWLDNRDKQAAREMEFETARAKLIAEHDAAWQERVWPLLQDSAELKFKGAEVDRLKKELEEARIQRDLDFYEAQKGFEAEIRRVKEERDAWAKTAREYEINWRQSETLAKFVRMFLRIFDTEEGEKLVQKYAKEALEKGDGSEAGLQR